MLVMLNAECFNHAVCQSGQECPDQMAIRRAGIERNRCNIDTQHSTAPGLIMHFDSVPPTRSAALLQIDTINPAAYARSRNFLNGAVTGLSPYITHGLITLPEVLNGVIQRHQPLDVGHKLVYELGWREYFRHVWAVRGDTIFTSLHQGPLPDAAYDPALPDDFCTAQTGVPVIDHAVRTLYSTGGLHNHARMWVASYLVHLRHVHWRAGADWMYRHLLDGDLASNYLSWQWVAGTGSHKPYLFNAENVARYAPQAWHSPGTVIDQSYAALDQLARGRGVPVFRGGSDSEVVHEPLILTVPPSALPILTPESAILPQLQGREVWLVHPWALHLPADGVPSDALILGVYPREFHQRWPWSAPRWQWVDAAMSAVAQERWLLDKRQLEDLLASAKRVVSVDNPHIRGLISTAIDWQPEPRLFPKVGKPCHSFSQWWKRASQSFSSAESLLMHSLTDQG
jgi:deoxyribodipyrimidine photo-lyase